MNHIYPLRVVAVNDGEVVLNQGGDSIKEGDFYEVFELGETIKDPYTGESLGQKETKCATIEIIRVKGKSSDGKIVSGSTKIQEEFNANKRYICRLLPSKAEGDIKTQITRPTTIAVAEVQLAPEMSFNKSDETATRSSDSASFTSIDTEDFGVDGFSNHHTTLRKDRDRSESFFSGTQTNINIISSIKKSLRTVLESDIFKTKKFNVLSRQDFKLLSQETGDAGRDVADYLLVPTIVDFHDKFVQVPVEGTLLFAKRKSFVLILELKVHDLKEKRILETFDAKITERDLDPNFLNMNPSQVVSDLYLNDICQKISSKTVQGLIDTVFPMCIVSIDEDVIYIDRGSEANLKAGDVFDVKSKGKAIIDDNGKVLGYKQRSVGKIRLVEVINRNLSECEVLSQKSAKRPFEKGQLVFKSKDTAISTATAQVSAPAPAAPVMNEDYDDRSKDEILKFNAVKSLRIQAANSYKELQQVKNKRAEGKKKIKEGTALSQRSDSVAGAGTTMARYVNNSSIRANGRRMVEEGERIMKEADIIEDRVHTVYRTLYDSCDTVAIRFSDGKDLVCIPLIYKNGIFTVLVNDKVFKIKEGDLDETSRKRVRRYK